MVVQRHSHGLDVEMVDLENLVQVFHETYRHLIYCSCGYLFVLVHLLMYFLVVQIVVVMALHVSMNLVDVRFDHPCRF